MNPEAQLPLRPGMEAVRPPTEVSVAGSAMLQCYGRDFVPVHTEDGVLLGAIPTFADAVEQVYTRQGTALSVGWLALRTVVAPYNRGIDPGQIDGFIPAPGYRPGPLATGQRGDNPDVGRAL